MKIEMIAGGEVRSIWVYSWPNVSSPWREVRRGEVRISKADFEARPAECWRTWVETLRSLPPGFYTVVVEAQPTKYVQDIRLGRRGGVKVRPYDGETINVKEQLPCLWIEVEQPFWVVHGTGTPNTR